MFRKFAELTSHIAGSPYAFLLALTIVVAWWLSGSTFGYSDTWQLFINTGTTIMTFLMVFLIQNTQNRDAKAIHLKLDELIHAQKNADNSFVDLENLSDDEIAKLQDYFQKIHAESTPKSFHRIHDRVTAVAKRRKQK
ncbi:MAG: low affinity iron permease family protein [Patescibacteria group bacterium]|jgi:low affinity Fe/Cu permease